MGTQALWSDHIWQPWRGCVRVSAGCQNCYMFRTLQQLKRDPTIVLRSNYDDWTLPYRLKGGMVQVCSQSDFFIDQADEWRAAAWDVMRDNPQLVYQILTKRPGRIEKHLPRDWGEGWVNVVLGVSAEDQTTADVRIPQLLRVPAAHYFVSAQPLLGPMHVASHLSPRRVSLVLTGCESGPDSRPTDTAWLRSLEQQCRKAKVRFFLVQQEDPTSAQLVRGSFHNARKCHWSNFWPFRARARRAA